MVKCHILSDFYKSLEWINLGSHLMIKSSRSKFSKSKFDVKTSILVNLLNQLHTDGVNLTIFKD